MKIQQRLSQFIRSFRLTEDEKPLANVLFQEQNIARLNFILPFSLPVFVIHMLIFYLNLPHEAGTEHSWRVSIILSHLSLFVVFLSIWVILRQLRRSNTFFSKTTIRAKRVSVFIIHFAYIFILFSGGMIATLDQAVTNSITPLLIACVILPLFLVVSPSFSLFYYALACIFFMWVHPLTQFDHNILLSNYVNGLTAVSIGLIGSLLFWRIHVQKFRQDMVIEGQKNELREQNEKLTESSNTLMEYSKELNNALDEKDKFFSIIAHDLRSPFQSFLGITELLAENTGEFSEEKIAELSKNLNKRAANLYELLKNLLEWSRIQKGSAMFQPSLLDMNSLIARNIEVIKQQAEQKGISIRNNTQTGLIAYADSGMIESVLRNILSNALKFTQKGGTVEISTQEDESDMLRVSITDTGVGMSEELCGKLFKINEKVGREGTEGEESTGLGLLLCKEFIERHGGTIRAESVPGKGSTFTFTIPSGAFSEKNS